MGMHQVAGDFMRSSVVVLLAVIHFGSSGLLLAQSDPVIDSGYANEFTVDGMADPASGSITVFDLSYEARTALGRGVVGRDGKFAVVVNPALIAGHQLVAVDKFGRASGVFTVAHPRAGPVPFQVR
jgi:hypothetical protein